MPFNFIHAPAAGAIAGPAAAEGAEDTRREMFRKNIQAIQAAQQQQQLDQSQQQAMAHLANQRWMAGVQGQQQNNQNVAQMQRMLIGNQFDQQQQQNLFGQQNARDAAQDQSQKDYADYTAKIKADAEQRQNQEQVQWRNNAINFGVNDPQYSSFTAARDRELQSFDYLPGQQETLKKIRNDRQGILDNLGKGMDQKQAQQMWSDLNKEEMKVWPTEKKPDTQQEFNKRLVKDPSGQYWVIGPDGTAKMGGKEKSDLPFPKTDEAAKMYADFFKHQMAAMSKDDATPDPQKAAEFAQKQVEAYAAWVDGTKIPVPATSDQVAPQGGAPAPADNRRQDSFPRPGDPGFAPNGQPPVAPNGPLPRLQLQEVRPDGTKGPVMQGFEGMVPGSGGQQNPPVAPEAVPSPQAPAGERPPASPPKGLQGLVEVTKESPRSAADREALAAQLKKANASSAAQAPPRVSKAVTAFVSFPSRQAFTNLQNEVKASTQEAEDARLRRNASPQIPPTESEKASGVLYTQGGLPIFDDPSKAHNKLPHGAKFGSPLSDEVYFSQGAEEAKKPVPFTPEKAGEVSGSILENIPDNTAAAKSFTAQLKMPGVQASLKDHRDEIWQVYAKHGVHTEEQFASLSPDARQRLAYEGVKESGALEKLGGVHAQSLRAKNAGPYDGEYVPEPGRVIDYIAKQLPDRSYMEHARNFVEQSFAPGGNGRYVSSPEELKKLIDSGRLWRGHSGGPIIIRTPHGRKQIEFQERKV